MTSSPVSILVGPETLFSLVVSFARTIEAKRRDLSLDRDVSVRRLVLNGTLPRSYGLILAERISEIRLVYRSLRDASPDAAQTFRSSIRAILREARQNPSFLRERSV